MLDDSLRRQLVVGGQMAAVALPHRLDGDVERAVAEATDAIGQPEQLEQPAGGGIDPAGPVQARQLAVGPVATEPSFELGHARKGGLDRRLRGLAIVVDRGQIDHRSHQLSRPRHRGAARSPQQAKLPSEAGGTPSGDDLQYLAPRFQRRVALGLCHLGLLPSGHHQPSLTTGNARPPGMR